MKGKYGQCIICGLTLPKQYLITIPINNNGQLKMVLACTTCSQEMLRKGGKNE